MKKLLCLVLALALLVSAFAACGKKDGADEPQKTGNPDQAQIEEPIESEKPEETPAPDESSTPAPGSKPAKNPGSSKPAKNPDSNSNVPSAATPAPSTNTDVATESDAPDVYLIVGGDDNAASISYHLKDCSLLNGAEAQKVAWEMIQTLGFRQCPKCNPPRYQGYIE